MAKPSSFSAFLDGSAPNEAEIRVIEACDSGVAAQLSNLPEGNRAISADLLAALVTGHFTHPEWPLWSLHDDGPKIGGAIVQGPLNLAFRTLPSGLRLSRCKLESADFSSSVIKGSLMLNRCNVSGILKLRSALIAGQFAANEAAFINEHGNAIDAQGVKAASWFMDGARVKGRFKINGAEFAGQFSADAAEMSNDQGDAINAQGVKAAGWFMNRARVTGRFVITSAEISGQFSANRTEFTNSQGDAIHAQAAKAAGWFMRGAKVVGRFAINGAELGGQFSANEAEFTNSQGDAFYAQGMKATAFFMDGAKVKGRININSAEFDKQFSANQATFENQHGMALLADFAIFHGGIFLRRCPLLAGGISFNHARALKYIDFSESSIEAGSRSALSLISFKAEGDMILNRTAISGGINASRAHFSALLHLRRAQIRCASRCGVAAKGHSFRHVALRLREARIDGRLVMPDTRPEGIVDLAHARCGILEDFQSGWPPQLKIRSSYCAERLSSEEDDHSRDIQHLVLDGLHYGHLEHPDGRAVTGGDVGEARKRWLAGQSAGDLHWRFNPQPWRRAAATLREMGYDEAAKVVAIERRDRERVARDAPRTQRWINWGLRLVADYGFNPKKTVLWCLGVIFFCAALYWSGMQICGDPNSRIRICDGQPLFIATQWGDADPRTVDGGYPKFDPLSYSLGAFVPLFDLGAEPYWHANFDAGVWFSIPVWLGHAGEAHSAEKPGRWSFTLSWSWGLTFYWLFVLQRVTGAILIAIAITGFTGFLTRDER